MSSGIPRECHHQCRSVTTNPTSPARGDAGCQGNARARMRILSRGREGHSRHQPPQPHGKGTQVPSRDTGGGHTDRLRARDAQSLKARRDLAKGESCLPEHSKPHTRLSVTHRKGTQTKIRGAVSRRMSDSRNGARTTAREERKRVKTPPDKQVKRRTGHRPKRKRNWLTKMGVNTDLPTLRNVTSKEQVVIVRGRIWY